MAADGLAAGHEGLDRCRMQAALPLADLEADQPRVEPRLAQGA